MPWKKKTTLLPINLNYFQGIFGGGMALILNHHFGGIPGFLGWGRFTCFVNVWQVICFEPSGMVMPVPHGATQAYHWNRKLIVDEAPNFSSPTLMWAHHDGEWSVVTQTLWCWKLLTPSTYQIYIVRNLVVLSGHPHGFC